jgi:Ca-activated chloride channel family protein
MRRPRRFGFLVALMSLLLILAACQGSASPSAEPSESTEASESASGSEPSEEAEASVTPRPDGPATIDAPAEVSAGSEFEVEFTGPNAQGDFIAIVPAGAEEWTNADHWFYSYVGSPGILQAPTDEGEFEIWYVSGDQDETVLAEAEIEVTAFEGSIDAPASVGTGDEFQVNWTGPDAGGDYITILAEGVTDWTNESWFYTYIGSPGTLTAPENFGQFLVWYVSGNDEVLMASDPIQVTP